MPSSGKHSPNDTQKSTDALREQDVVRFRAVAGAGERDPRKLEQQLTKIADCPNQSQEAESSHKRAFP